MACGTPVITTATPAMNEVLAGGATFVSLRSPATIAAESIRLLKEPRLREEQSGNAREFAARFSWEKAAVETAAVYREIAE
jgi:glycosyltransferase involved in cell wall biosynthesis